MKFRVIHFELTVEDADPSTSVQRISAMHDHNEPHPGPQLHLTLSGPDILQFLSKGDTLELDIPARK